MVTAAIFGLGLRFALITSTPHEPRGFHYLLKKIFPAPVVAKHRECEELFAVDDTQTSTTLARGSDDLLRVTIAEGHELILHDMGQNQAFTNAIVQFRIVRGEPKSCSEAEQSLH